MSFIQHCKLLAYLKKNQKKKPNKQIKNKNNKKTTPD